MYARLRTQIQELNHNLGGLPRPAEAAGIWKDIWHLEAHHSTAIEGNTLVLKEVTALLEEGRAVGDKELREYMEVRGYAAASEWVYGTGQTSYSQDADRLITLTEIREVHYRALTPVWDVAPHPGATDAESPGKFREHEIHPFPAGMTPTSYPLIPAELDLWLDLISVLDPDDRDFPEMLAQVHARFEQVHPFIDGNGRTGRLLLNLILVRMGHPPMIVYKSERDTYLKALRRADAGDYGSLGEFIARAILDSLYRFIVPAVAGPARLVPLAALATKDVKAVALRTAANRGVLQATKGPDGQWRSSRNWVDEYLQGRWQRRAG